MKIIKTFFVVSLRYDITNNQYCIFDEKMQDFKRFANFELANNYYNDLCNKYMPLHKSITIDNYNYAIKHNSNNRAKYYKNVLLKYHDYII